MKQTQNLLKGSKLLLAASALMAIALASSHAFAQEEKTEFIQRDAKQEVTIRHYEVGLVLTEKALEDPAGAIDALDSMGIKLPDVIDSGPLIGTIATPLARKGLLQRSRELYAARSDLIKVAGFVVRYPGTESFNIVTDEFLVKFKKGISDEQINDLHASHGVKLLLKSPYIPGLQLVSIPPEGEIDALTLSNQYNEEDIVEYAHPNFVRRSAPRQAADPLLSRQWHLNNTGLSGGTPDADIDADRAWAMERGDPNIRIAILDGGFDMNHEDLKDNVWTNPGDSTVNNADTDANGYKDDVHGWNFAPCPVFPPAGCGNNNPTWQGGWGKQGEHGTLSAGAAVARGNNGIGVSGSCPDCQFIPIRLGNAPWADHLAIGYANQVGAQIISNSWGCDPDCMSAVVDVMNLVATTGRGGLGIPIFVAMPDREDQYVNRCNALPTGEIDDYSSLDAVIAVGMVDNNDQIRIGPSGTPVVGGSFGNCMDVLGPSWGGTLWATTTDLSGDPGYNNTFIDPLGRCPEGPDHNYTFCATGSSFAAPVVAGVAGLLLSTSPGLSRIEIQRLLQDTADKVQPSTASYREVNGFSRPPSGEATHGYGRINAYEAVHIVAPVVAGGGANSGLGGVDVFVRDNDLDWGNTEQPSSTLFDSPRGFVPHWNSADMKVDAPPFSTLPIDSAGFEALNDEDPVSGAVNRVYVRVRNRGPNPANSVTVKLHWAFAGAGMPPLPGDFWTSFPNNSSDTSSWKPIAAQTITGLAYSGASVAGTPADPAKILRFDFAAPEFDSSLPNPTHYCLFAVINSPQDPVSAQTIASTNVDDISPRDNNITQRNVMLVPLTNLNPFAFLMNVGNPFGRAIEIKLHLDAPEGWAVEESEVPFDKAFEMEPGEKRLVKVTLKTAALPGGHSANIYQVAVGEASHQEKVLSGITIRAASE